MVKRLKSGGWVQHSGRLNYSNENGIPDSITMTARTRQGLLFQETVRNEPGWQTTR
ncbi:hypothetical protein GCM10010252_06740 [Streptomyces aureoverticillatus]|nr:hypothetical protein GCM10010252_06740 [Streptomyces aureoverticillatus]